MTDKEKKDAMEDFKKRLADSLLEVVKENKPKMKLIPHNKIELTEVFVTTNADLVDWDYVSSNIDTKKFSSDFFSVFSDKINWENIYLNFRKDCLFKNEHKDKLDIAYKKLDSRRSTTTMISELQDTIMANGRLQRLYSGAKITKKK